MHACMYFTFVFYIEWTFVGGKGRGIVLLCLFNNLFTSRYLMLMSDLTFYS